MRTSEKFYKALMEIHQTCLPDWRFGQLLINFLGAAGDPFYWEETVFLQKLQQYLEKEIAERFGEESARIIDKYYNTDREDEVEEKSDWIPVDKALPQDEVEVLVCSDTGNIEVACGSRSTEIEDEFIWYTNGKFTWHTSGWKMGRVVAWKPLPEPYKEK